MNDHFVCEYSPRGDCFHVDGLEECLVKNRWAVKGGYDPGFLPLGVFETEEEALAYARKWQKILNNRRSREEV